MQTKRLLRLLLAFSIVAASTFGGRPRAAAAEPLPSPIVPADVTTPAVGTPPPLVLQARPDLLEILAEDERQQFIARDSAWIAAEREAWLQIERDRWAAEAEAARAATVSRPGVRAAPAGAIAPEIASIIVGAAERHGIDPVRFLRIAFCESGGNPSAYNRSGASGLFQQLAQYWPGRAAAAGLPGADPFDPWANAEVSAWLYASSGSSHWNPSRYCWG